MDIGVVTQMSDAGEVMSQADHEVAQLKMGAGELIALTQLVFALGRVVAGLSPEVRARLQDDVQQSMGTLSSLAEINGGDGETMSAITTLALFQAEIA